MFSSEAAGLKALIATNTFIVPEPILYGMINHTESFFNNELY